MPLFTYKVRDATGKVIEDTAQGANREEVALTLKGEGFTVLTVRALDSGFGGVFGGRVSVSEKAAFCRFMTIMLRAGMPIPEAAEIIREETQNKKLKKILLDIAGQTRRGKSLSSVLMKYDSDFDPIFLTMIKAGEQSGTLEQSFEYLTRQLVASYDLSQKVKGSLMYPAVIVVAMVGVGLLMLLGVLPRISDVFLKLDLELPIYTKIVLGVGEFVGKNTTGVLVGVGVVGLLIFLFLFLRTTRNILINLLLHVPFANKIVKQIDLARFSRTVSTLLKSGVPIMETLNVAADSLSSAQMRVKAKMFSSDIAKGESLSEVMVKNRKLFPMIMVQTVKAGEKTGTLEEVLTEVADFYEREVDYSLKRFTSILEPVLMLVVGVAVGVMIVIMISPIYSIVGGLQNAIQR